MVGFAEKQIWGLAMFMSFNSARNAATAFAGAFITAMLFVSAATSLPIA